MWEVRTRERWIRKCDMAQEKQNNNSPRFSTRAPTKIAMHTLLTEVVVDVKTEVPIEVISEILAFTDRKTLKACCLVNKAWFSAASDDIFWNIYRDKIATKETNAQGQSLRILYIEARKFNAEVMKQKRRRLALNRTSKGC